MGGGAPGTIGTDWTRLLRRTNKPPLHVPAHTSPLASSATDQTKRWRCSRSPKFARYLQIIVMVKDRPLPCQPTASHPSGADGQDSATAMIRRSGGVHTFLAQELQTATASADPQPTFTVLICRESVGREEVGPAKADAFGRGSWPQAKTAR